MPTFFQKLLINDKQRNTGDNVTTSQDNSDFGLTVHAQVRGESKARLLHNIDEIRLDSAKGTAQIHSMEGQTALINNVTTIKAWHADSWGSSTGSK